MKNSKRANAKSFFVGLWLDRNMLDNLNWEAGENDRTISAEIRAALKKHLRHLTAK